MPDFSIKQLPHDLIYQAGLALIGKYLQRIKSSGLRLPGAQWHLHQRHPQELPRLAVPGQESKGPADAADQKAFAA